MVGAVEVNESQPGPPKPEPASLEPARPRPGAGSRKTVRSTICSGASWPPGTNWAGMGTQRMRPSQPTPRS